MSGIVDVHIERLRTAVLKKHTAASIAKWITEETTYGGQPYSYVGHEYQEAILSDTSVEVNVQKCSQVGVSEASARMALAMVNVISPFTVAYTLPTAHFAGTFTKTRVDTVIDGSKLMKSAIHKTTDNNEIKRFGDSFLYVRGAASSNAPISIPCDMLIHDEYDFSAQDVLTQYISRLTHSKWKFIRRFSTPTLPDFGINKEFKQSRRFLNLCKCNHCNFWFTPDYYSHVKIPDFKGDLRIMNKQTLSKIRWKEAKLHCPSCHKVPNLMPQHREYVCENPDSGYVAAGYQVSPFDAPTIIDTSYLVKASTDYARVQDFVNFGLGLPAEDSEATLTREDFVNLFVHAEGSAGVNVMGVDVGNVYHFVVGSVDAWGDMVILHREQVPMGTAKKRYGELRSKFRVVCSVIDSGPHAETVMSLQEQDPNLYASVYMRSKSILTHNVVDKDKDKDKGQEFLRQVNVNRSRAFDGFMNFIRENHLTILKTEEDELFIQHHCSMKRVKQFDSESGEMVYSWVKTDGEDHFHHAALYCWLAGKIKGVSSPTIILPTTGVFTFRNKSELARD